MLPESVNSSDVLFVVAAIILAVGIGAAAVGTLIKRRLDEEHRDERYVREKRGETVTLEPPPRIAGLLQHAGFAVAGFGLVVLVVAWTLAPGPS